MPNDFQIERAELFSKFIDKENAFLFDIGSGDGAQLIAIRKSCPNLKIVGSDCDQFACELIKKNNFKSYYLETEDLIFDLLKKYKPDYVTLFEVIEHMYSPEDLILELTNNKSIKNIFISVPNSGFFSYRLRFLLGRFPCQWIVNPNEHIRFWTLKDLSWWLEYLNIKKKSRIVAYKGIPILNKILPNLFAQGAFIIIKN